MTAPGETDTLMVIATILVLVVILVISLWAVTHAVRYALRRGIPLLQRETGVESQLRGHCGGNVACRGSRIDYKGANARMA